MKLWALATVLLSTASTVTAHAYIKKFIVDGVEYPGWDPFMPEVPQPGIINQPWDVTTRNRKNTDAYVPPSNSDEVVCKQNAQPVPTVPQARAGAYVEFHWTRWQINHIGPIQTYLADCNGNCATAIGARLAWFKIDEANFDPGSGLFPTEVLQKQGKTYTIQLPKNLKDGQYLMRHEMIGYQNKFKDQVLPGLQLYPNCINVAIMGGTGTVTPQAVMLQGYYAMGAPGVMPFDVQRQQYPLPGPPLTPDLGNTPSSQLNAGINKNPDYNEFQEKLNEPTDDNGTRPNFHLDWFAKNNAPYPQVTADQKRSVSPDQASNQAANEVQPPQKSYHVASPRMRAREYRARRALKRKL